MPGEDLEEAVKRFKWYQRIPLGNGLYTPGEGGDIEAKLEMLQLPEDLSGKSVLDIGCNEGFFAFEAERRGAARVLAIDSSDKAQEKLEVLKRIKTSRVEFRRLDVYDLDEGAVGRFDLVLFLSVFHHLRYPFLGLDRIAAVTDGLAVMEVPVAVATAFTEGLDDEPLMIRRFGKTGRLRLLPNVPFLVEMLERAGFPRVDILGTHRRRTIRGYANRYVQERVVLKACRQE